MSKQARYMMRVQKGALVPADRFTEQQLRAKGFHVGDIVSITVGKARNPRFHRLAHQLGALLVENLEQFEGLDAHRALKRLQVEANIACDEMAIYVPGVGKCQHLTPRSLSFDSMDESEFRAVFAALCRHVARTYWPNLTPEKVEEMAELMPEAA